MHDEKRNPSKESKKRVSSIERPSNFNKQTNTLNPLKIVLTKKENPQTIKYHPIAPKIESIIEKMSEEHLLTEPTLFLKDIDASKISLNNEEEQTILIENEDAQVFDSN